MAKKPRAGLVRLSRRFKERQGVRLETNASAALVGGAWDPRVHAAHDNAEHQTRVTTYCGGNRFVTYAMGSRKPVDCLDCIARGG